MQRRSILASTAAFACIGCLGDEGDSDEPLVSEGNDDVPIDRSSDELLLSIDDLDGEWETEATDRDQCRAFSKSTDVGDIRLTSCAWVLDDTEDAEAAFESRVDDSQFREKRRQDEEPEIGVNAAVVAANTEIDVIFRDANAVGLVEYELDPDGMIDEEDIPGPEDGIVHAVTMHQQWRE